MLMLCNVLTVALRAAALPLMASAAQCGTQLGIATTAQHWTPLGLGQVVDLRNGPQNRSKRKYKEKEMSLDVVLLLITLIV